MKKIVSVSGIFILAVVLCFGIIWRKDNNISDDTILASVGDFQITQSDIALIQRCDAVVVSFQENSHKPITTKEALESLISQQVKKQMIQNEGICLPEQEQEQIRETILWSFDETEKILQSGSEQEKEMAERSMDVIQAFIEAYGVSMDEYKELCIDNIIFSVEVSRLAERNFNGDKEALESYIRKHYKDYKVVIS